MPDAYPPLSADAYPPLPRFGRVQSAGGLRSSSAATAASAGGLHFRHRRLHASVRSAAGAELRAALARRPPVPSDDRAAGGGSDEPSSIADSSAPEPAAEPAGHANLSVEQIACASPGAARRYSTSSPNRLASGAPRQARPLSASLDVGLLGSRSAGWVGTIDWHDVGGGGVPGRPASACAARPAAPPLVQTAVSEGVAICRPPQVVPRHMRALPYEWMASLRASPSARGLHAGLIGAAHKRGEWLSPAPDDAAGPPRRPVPPWLGHFRMGSLQHDRHVRPMPDLCE